METPVTGLLQAKPNPFAEIEDTGWFAADLEPTRYDFTLFGRPCFISIRPMDASAETRFTGQLMALPRRLERLAEDAEAVQVFEDLQMELLLACVVDAQLVRKATSKDGQTTFVQSPPWKELPPDGKRQVFREAGKSARRITVELCCAANALDPLMVGSGGMKDSPEPSASLTSNTETSAPDSESPAFLTPSPGTSSSSGSTGETTT